MLSTEQAFVFIYFNCITKSIVQIFTGDFSAEINSATVKNQTER